MVLKALRKEPEERYASVDQFMADLQAYLDGLPVAARQGSFRYRAGKFVRRNKLALGAAGLLSATVMAGIGGIVWQARIANAERHRAEARAEDLRKLSNSLLSEIDEAIQKIPGSTPAQKLLVGTVLEHLDRAARDSSGDAEMAVDLADAYIRLGNVQGNPYDQNIGDAQGALTSLGKALSIASALVGRQPGNGGAAHAMGWAEQSRSEVLFGMGRTQEAAATMRAAAATYNALASQPGAKADALYDAATAYGGLGDELGQNGTASLSDPAGALAAFHKSLELDERIARLDPGFSRAMRGVAVNHLKIANIVAETDPAAALVDYRDAIQGMNSLPEESRKSLLNRRTLANIYSKNGLALKEVGRYQEALSYLEEAKAIAEPFVAADPNDMRAGNDLQAILENEAECFEQRAAGVFAEGKTDRRADALSALKSLSESRALTEHLLQKEPESIYLRSTLGLLMIRISLQQRALHRIEGTVGLAAQGVALLKVVGEQENAHGVDLDAAATGLTIVQPVELRDPRLAVECAERMVKMSHRQKPGYFLTMAHAYRAGGQGDKARAAAQEGLALLPAATPSTVASRIRKQLQSEAAG
jgi:tetratricopeptide (TPR) repeat protein